MLSAGSSAPCADCMKKFLTALALVLGVLTSTLCGGSNETLATFDGGSVSAKDVEKNNEQEFYEIRQKEYQIRQQAAFETAREKIFEAEAKKRNLPVDKFVEAELAKRRGSVSDEMVRQFYENNNQRGLHDRSG